MDNKTKHYSFFQNRACEYFPCHKGIEEKAFNCLFCYCPLYALGENCGGNYTYLENGIKDCSGCRVPHVKDKGYDHVMSKYGELMELAKRK